MFMLGEKYRNDHWPLTVFYLLTNPTFWVFRNNQTPNCSPSLDIHCTQTSKLRTDQMRNDQSKFNALVL